MVPVQHAIPCQIYPCFYIWLCMLEIAFCQTVCSYKYRMHQNKSGVIRFVWSAARLSDAEQSSRRQLHKYCLTTLLKHTDSMLHCMIFTMMYTYWIAIVQCVLSICGLNQWRTVKFSNNLTHPCACNIANQEVQARQILAWKSPAILV